MNDHDLHDLFHDAVADVGGTPEFGAMAHRLAAVDRRRKVGVMLAGASAIVAASFGVASAWPENQQPLQLRLGDVAEVDQAGDVELDGPDGPVESSQEEIAAPSPEPDAEESAARAEAPEPDEPVVPLDWGATLDLSGIAPDPTAVPTPPPTPHPTPHPTPVPPPPRPAPKSESGNEGHGSDEDQGDGEAGGQAVAFTAAAAYGSCEEPIPYDIYSGTAAPGAAVTVTSPHSATTSATADATGHWSARVTFEAAPVGALFTVTVTSGGDSFTFGFTRTG